MGTKEIKNNCFFTNLVYSRIQGFFKAFVVLINTAVVLAAAGIALIIMYKYAAALTIFWVAAFFLVCAMVMLFSYLAYNKKYKNCQIPFMKVFDENISKNDVLSICDKDYAEGSILYTTISGKKTLDKVVILPSYVVLIKTEIEFIPTVNILWIYGSLSYIKYKINGITQKRRTNAVYIYYKLPRRGKTGKTTGNTFALHSKKSEAEAFLKALVSANPTVLAGRNKKLLKIYKNDPKVFLVFFEKYVKLQSKSKK